MNIITALLIALGLVVRPIEIPQNPVIEPTPVPIIEQIEPPIVATKSAQVAVQVVRGKVSHYSVDGCLGCSKTLTMSNGERLDDNVPTIACNRLPMNKRVRVTNLDNGLSVEARVTDRGGFEKYNRVADLTPAVYKEIGTKTDISEVLIEVIE